MNINDEVVLLSADGRFTYDMGLRPGRNRATIAIVDVAGNTLTETVYIEYDQPLTGTGWFWMVLVGLLVVGGVVGGGLFFWKKRKGRLAARKPKKVKRPIKKGAKGGGK
jgi:LPXTG-motif cell wall-anchored protein